MEYATGPCREAADGLNRAPALVLPLLLGSTVSIRPSLTAILPPPRSLVPPVSGPQRQVHWFSIINSLLIVVFLTGMIGMILIRNVHRDISRYNRVLTDEEKQEEREESGWKLVHTDVFRPPATNPMLLCVFVGTGVQLFYMGLITILFSAIGVWSMPPRGRGESLSGWRTGSRPDTSAKASVIASNPTPSPSSVPFRVPVPGEPRLPDDRHAAAVRRDGRFCGLLLGEPLQDFPGQAVAAVHHAHRFPVPGGVLPHLLRLQPGAVVLRLQRCRPVPVHGE